MQGRPINYMFFMAYRANRSFTLLIIDGRDKPICFGDKRHKCLHHCTARAFEHLALHEVCLLIVGLPS